MKTQTFKTKIYGVFMIKEGIEDGGATANIEYFLFLDMTDEGIRSIEVNLTKIDLAYEDADESLNLQEFEVMYELYQLIDEDTGKIGIDDIYVDFDEQTIELT